MRKTHLRKYEKFLEKLVKIKSINENVLHILYKVIDILVIYFIR